MLRKKFPGQENFHLPGGVVFAAVGTLFAMLLASRMGISELLALVMTAVLSSLNWLAIRRNIPPGKSLPILTATRSDSS